MLVLTTQIAMSGATEPKTLGDILEDITHDCSVLSFDGKNVVYSDVVNTRVCTSHDFVYLKTDTGDNLVLTPDQKVYDPVQKQWIKSGELNKCVKLLNHDKQAVSIEDIHTIHDQMASRVCTLTVAETQCYYANNILVHNSGS